jgi:hypothetical protein
MRHKFISLKEPTKYGYIYDSEAWSTGTRFCMSRHFQQCETYGDVHENGNYIQHSGEWTVQVEFLADYLASLATYIMANPGEETDKLLHHVSYDVTRRPSDASIAFAASVKFKSTVDSAGEATGYEKHRRWFSTDEKKVSASESKRYDKRYTEVDKQHDGSPDAIYRMLIPEYADGLEFYTYADAIRDWCQADPDHQRPYFYGHAAQFLKWFDGDTRKAADLRCAYKACLSLALAHQHRAEAECMLHNLHWPPKTEVQENGLTAEENRTAASEAVDAA